MDKYQARKIRCTQCDALFVFSEEKQRRYKWNHFPDPEQCEQCRARNKRDYLSRCDDCTGCFYSNGLRHPLNIRQQHYRRYGGS